MGDTHPSPNLPQPLPAPTPATTVGQSPVSFAPPPPRSYKEAMVGQTSRPIVKIDGTSGNHKSFFDVNAKKLGEFSFHQARKTLRFSGEEMNVLSQPFKFALIGKFSHGYPTMQVIESEIAGFGLGGDFKIRVLNVKHILIQLSLEEDFSKLWIRQILLVDNFPMRLFKWTPTFNPKEESPFAPVWIRLPNLPVQFFDKNALFSIASMIGSPLRVDDATADFSRPSLARVCVDINLEQPLDTEVALGFDSLLWVQKIEYERIPQYCTRCKHIGHNVNHCYSVKTPVPETQMQKGNMVHKDAPKNLTLKPTNTEIEMEKNLLSKNSEDLRMFLDNKRDKDARAKHGPAAAPKGAHSPTSAHGPAHSPAHADADGALTDAVSRAAAQPQATVHAHASSEVVHAHATSEVVHAHAVPHSALMRALDPSAIDALDPTAPQAAGMCVAGMSAGTRFAHAAANGKTNVVGHAPQDAEHDANVPHAVMHAAHAAHVNPCSADKDAAAAATVHAVLWPAHAAHASDNVAHAPDHVPQHAHASPAVPHVANKDAAAAAAVHAQADPEDVSTSAATCHPPAGHDHLHVSYSIDQAVHVNAAAPIAATASPSLVQQNSSSPIGKQANGASNDIEECTLNTQVQNSNYLPPSNAENSPQNSVHDNVKDEEEKDEKKKKKKKKHKNEENGDEDNEAEDASTSAAPRHPHEAEDASTSAAPRQKEKKHKNEENDESSKNEKKKEMKKRKGKKHKDVPILPDLLPGESKSAYAMRVLRAE